MGNGYSCNGERKMEMECMDGMKRGKHVGSFGAEKMLIGKPWKGEE